MRDNRFTLFGLLLLWSFAAEAGPKIEHWTTNQGTRVYFVEAKGLPLIDIRVMFDAGSARDGEQFGVASLTSALLDSGAGEWDAGAIAERIEGVGAMLSTNVSRDSASLSLRSLTEPRILDSVLETAHTVLIAANFAADDFNRDKNRTLAALKQREESPGQLANMAYYQALYGDHPYAHPTSGETTTVERLKRADLVSFYRRYYVAANAIVVIVGEVDRSKAESIVATLMNGMAVGEQAAPLPDVTVAAKGSVERIDFPSTQTHIFSGSAAVRRGDADHFTLYVGNHILGGSGLLSDISQAVREERGLAYSAYSYFSPMRRKGPFTMGLQTRNDQADEALTVMNQTLASFLKDGPTEQQLVAAKKNITGGFVLRIDSNSKLLGYVAMIGFYGLPLDYLDHFNEKVEAVTLPMIRDAFKRHLNPERFKTVLVGGKAAPEADAVKAKRPLVGPSKKGQPPVETGSDGKITTAEKKSEK